MDANPEMRSKAKCGAIGLLVVSIIGTNLLSLLLAIFFLSAISGGREKWMSWRSCLKCYYLTVIIILAIVCVSMCALTIYTASVGALLNVTVAAAIVCIMFALQVSLANRAYAGFSNMYPDEAIAQYSQPQAPGQYYPQAPGQYYPPPPPPQYQPAGR